MDKPTKPTDLIPRSFGGVKNNFSPSLQSSGYEDGVPAIYGGDNLNYQLDATGKELDYCETICDFINNIPIGNTITVDSNNKLIYEENKTVRHIGEIATSTIPLTDAGLHLLDGALIQGSGVYSAFVTYIAGLVTDYPDRFTTEADWQTAVTTYGVCGKFVYDSVNNTVRLPKWGSQIFTKTSSVASTVPVVGNGKTIGLVDSTNTGYGLTAANSYLIGNKAPYGQNIGTASASGQNYTGTTSLGLTSSGSASGIVANLTSALTEYPLDCYYYIVIASTTKTNIQVDIDQIATDLNGKADVDLTNINNSCKTLDGQWVYTNTQIATNVTAPTTDSLSYSLSSYLPNDAYNYEVLFVANGTTGSTSGDRVYLELETDIQPNVCYVGLARTRTASDVSCAGACIMAVGSGREVVIVATGNNTGYISLRALGYRRIGTNQ